MAKEEIKTTEKQAEIDKENQEKIEAEKKKIEAKEKAEKKHKEKENFKRAVARAVQKAKNEAFFIAKLELTGIDRKSLRYRVVNPKGALNDIHHIQFIRTDETGEDTKVFPIDDGFNMDFINADLKNAKPYGDIEAEGMLAEEKELAEEALENAKKKQTEFKKFRKFELVIS